MSYLAVAFTSGWLVQASADKEQEYVEERGRLKAELLRLQQDLAFYQKSSADEERRLTTSAMESQAAADRAEHKCVSFTLCCKRGKDGAFPLQVMSMDSLLEIRLTYVCSVLRAKLAEDATQKLRAEAVEATQRAVNAEVKVEVLQKAVQQAEERVATLEMQVSYGD